MKTIKGPEILPHYVVNREAMNERYRAKPQKKLATIQEIKEIKPHPNADRLELATVLGWQVVVGKGDFNVGDKCVYVQIDSVVDINRYPFNLIGLKNTKIKTIKLRGEVSQGLAVKVNGSYEVGDDVTEKFGVRKYEKRIPQGNFVGGFPEHIIPKTDEERIQNSPEILEEFYGNPFYITIKHDGSSMTVICPEDGSMRVCGRNWEIEEGDNAYWNTAKEYNFPKGYVYQGELVGPGIQGNKENYSEKRFLIFNVFSLKSKSLLTFNQLSDLLVYPGANIEFVDLYMAGEKFPRCMSLNGLLEMANEARYSNGAKAEGLVLRGQNYDFKKHKLSCKIISNDYLIDNDE